MNPMMTMRAVLALTLAVTIPACAAAGPQEDTEAADASTAALARDAGDGELDCGECVKNASSPKGGYMTCVTATGTRRIACVPIPPPPPPPPPPTATCTDVTTDGTCSRLCCTTTTGSKRCSALPCGSKVSTLGIGTLGGLLMK